MPIYQPHLLCLPRRLDDLDMGVVCCLVVFSVAMGGDGPWAVPGVGFDLDRPSLVLLDVLGGNGMILLCLSVSVSRHSTTQH